MARLPTIGVHAAHGGDAVVPERGAGGNCTGRGLLGPADGTAQPGGPGRRSVVGPFQRKLGGFGGPLQWSFGFSGGSRKGSLGFGGGSRKGAVGRVGGPSFAARGSPRERLDRECGLPSTGDVPTTMASPGDLAPWAGLAGFLLLLASFVAMWWRARKPHAPPIAG